MTLLFFAAVLAAQMPITLEDIWQRNTFKPKTVPGFTFRKDGRNYTMLEEGAIRQYDITTGQRGADLFPEKAHDVQKTLEALQIEGFESYTFSDDGQKVLLSTESVAIYRHSFKASYFVYDFDTHILELLYGTSTAVKVSNPTFSPDGSKVAFNFENNLYIKNLANKKVTQVTTDGKQNAVINGSTDWVYEEEFAFTRAYEWSPDSKYIGFIRFDESKVPELTMQRYNYTVQNPDVLAREVKGNESNGYGVAQPTDMYPEAVTFKYPKVGEANAQVSVMIYEVTTAKITKANLQHYPGFYVPRIKWTKAPYQLCILEMNRPQNELLVQLADPATGETKLLLKEKSEKYYISIHDNLTFLAGGKRFVWTSELGGYNHAFLYNMDTENGYAKLERQLTKGDWDVTNFYGVDEKRQCIYYQAADVSPMQRQIYSQPLDGSPRRNIVVDAGFNDVQFSSTYDYLVCTASNINTPPVYTVYDGAGRRIRTIEDNAAIAELQTAYGTVRTEFFQFTTSGGVALNGWIMKPAKMKKKGKYPVFMFQYGGPGSQKVLDQWMGPNYWWFQMLVQKGYVVACVDNRGTGARGETFKKMTQNKLGYYETIDQIEAAKWLGSQQWADPTRIGIFGWSYGGFMATNCILKGNDVFKAAIAVAPVTNWKWYDTIYTERYMSTESQNPQGYLENSPVNYAEKLKGKYLIVHGLADDNVHFQHTAEMTRALVAANKPFESFFYPNCNHGISGGTTRLHLYTKMTDFVLENL